MTLTDKSTPIIRRFTNINRLCIIVVVFCVVAIFISLLSVAFAFFSDIVIDNDASAQVGCVQITSTLRIDQQVGDNLLNTIGGIGCSKLVTALGIPNCDNLPCNGQNQGNTSVIVQPNTIHRFTYTLENTGTVKYRNYTGDRIAEWLDSSYAPIVSLSHLLLYPVTIDDAIINAEIDAMQNGMAINSPSAIANLDGTCSVKDSFYGTDTGIPSCMTSVLSGTLNGIFAVGEIKTYQYKFVLYVPNSLAVYDSAEINLGLSSGAQGIMAANWKQQIHPFVNANTPTGNIPTFTLGNTQPFLDQVVADNVMPDASQNQARRTDYLQNLVKATDVEDGDCGFDNTTECVIILSDDGGFDSSVVGKYNLLYQITDSQNNMVEAVVTVEVWNFIDIESGQYHTLALGSNGSLWTFGYNNSGQRGVGSFGNAVSISGGAPSQIPQSSFNNHRILAISAGYSTSYAIDDTGQAWAWGQGSNYQLGNNSTSNTSVPVMVTMPQNITFSQISGFRETVAALGSDGNIYSWGTDTYGSTGVGKRNDDAVRTPTKITNTADFKFVDQGWYGGVAVNNSGQVYVWGTNIEYELGNGTASQKSCATANYRCTPTLNNSLSNISTASYGLYNILALSNDGQVYAWGVGANGRLGLGNSSTGNISTPKLISGLTGVSQINAGYDFGQFRVGSDLYSTGYANYGKLFLGNTNTMYVPTKTAMTNVIGNVKDVTGLYQNAFILSTDGKIVYGIGYSNSSDREFGNSTPVGADTSVSAVVPWSFTPMVLY